MKVLLINGSPRKQGNTYTALNEIAQQLNKQGVESEIMWIGNKAVRGCIACGACKNNGDSRCVFGSQDITNEVIAKMAECDAIILGSTCILGTAIRSAPLSSAENALCRWCKFPRQASGSSCSLP